MNPKEIRQANFFNDDYFKLFIFVIENICIMSCVIHKKYFKFLIFQRRRVVILTPNKSEVLSGISRVE